MKLSITKTVVFFTLFFGLFLITSPVSAYTDQASCEQEKYADLGSNGFQSSQLSVDFRDGITLSQATNVIQSYGFTLNSYTNPRGTFYILIAGNVPMGQEITYACRLEIEHSVEVTSANVRGTLYTANAPDIGGEVISTTGSTSGFSGLWVKWSSFHDDGLGVQEFVRYVQVDGSGRFRFDSWANVGQGRRDGEFNRMIDTDGNGTLDSRQANTNAQGHFGCESNPHTFTVVKPVGWSGSFSLVTININNGVPNLNLQITYNPTTTPTPTPTPTSSYSLTGHVYSDSNNNSSWDASDPGMPGEVVQLLNNSTGVLVSEATADSNGYYSISGIAAGGYTACHRVDPLWPGWRRVTPRCTVLNINSNSTASFGLQAYMEGYVFEDNNRDAVFNSGDIGLASHTVQLLNNSTGAAVAAAQTDSAGYYLILPAPYNAGGYTVRQTTLPPGWNWTTSQDQVRGMYNFAAASFGIDNTPVSISPLSVSCSGSPDPANISQTVTWTGGISGGSTPYTITWSGAASGSTQNVSTSYSTSGPKTAVFSVTDGLGNSNNTSCSIGVSTPGPFGQSAPVPTCGNMRLSWAPYAEAADYKIYFWRNGDANYTDNGITTFGPTAFKDLNASHGLIAGQSYSFLIEARNSAGQPIRYSNEGLWSHQVYGTMVTYPNCAPPGPFNQNQPVPSCPGNSPQIALGWTNSVGATSYRVSYFDTAGGGQQDRPELGIQFNANANSSWQPPQSAALIPGHDYSFIIRASGTGYAYSNNLWSHQIWGYTKYPNCSAPISQLWINNQPHTGLPIHVNQNTPAVLTWQSSNSTSSTPSSNPANAAWNATNTTATPSGGSFSINTSTPGTYQFTLTSSNSMTTHPANAATITLIVDQYPKPFIQTTGGDVHTNESIYITPNTP